MSLAHRIRRVFAIAAATRGRNFLLRNLKPPLPFWAHKKKYELLAPDSEGARCTYSEVVAEDAYKLRDIKSKAPTVIVDIGANIGLFSSYVSALFPTAEVHAFEPNPEAFSFLRQNAAQFPKVNIENKAVSCEHNQASLVCKGESMTGYIVPSSSGSATVECIHPSQIVGGRQIDLLKIDCEGSEFDILSDPTLLRRSRYCRMEFHFDEKHTLQQLLDLIDKGGHCVIDSLPKNIGASTVGYLYTQLKE